MNGEADDNATAKVARRFALTVLLRLAADTDETLLPYTQAPAQ